MMAAEAIINKKAFYHPKTLRLEVASILKQLISNKNL
jgi:hypothetical protein